MKKLRKLSLVLTLVMILTGLFGVTAAATESPYFFELGGYTIHLAPGDVLTRPIIVDNSYSPTYSIYVVGNTSKDTYAWSDSFKTGGSMLEIHVGKDEKASSFAVHVYVDGLERYDSLCVYVVDPLKSDIDKTRAAAWQAKKAANAVQTEATEVYNGLVKNRGEAEAKKEAGLLAQYYEALAKTETGDVKAKDNERAFYFANFAK